MTTSQSRAAQIGMNLPAVRQCLDELDTLLERLGAIAAQLAATRVMPADYSVTGAALAAAADAKQTEIWQTLVKLAAMTTAKRETLQAAVDAVEKHDEQSATEHHSTGSRLDRVYTA